MKQVNGMHSNDAAQERVSGGSTDGYNVRRQSEAKKNVGVETNVVIVVRSPPRGCVGAR
jgi:hypothetical protein